MLKKTLLLGFAISLAGVLTGFAQPAPVGEPFLVDGSTDGTVYGADVAIAPAGRFVVVWSESTPNLDPPDHVFARIFDPAAEPLSGEIDVAALVGPAYAARPRVVLASADSFVVGWLDTYRGIMARRFGFDGVPLGEILVIFQIENEDDFYLGRFGLCADPAANFLLAWRENDVVWARRYDTAEQRLSDRLLIAEHVPAVQGHGEPTVDCAAGETAIVAWHYATALEVGIMARRVSTAGGPLGDVVIVVSQPIPPVDPRVAIDDGGRWTVVWGGYQTPLTARFYDTADQPLTAPVAVSPEYRYPSNLAGFDVMATTGGGFLMLWGAERPGPFSFSPRRWSLLARRFSAGGEPLDEPVKLPLGGTSTGWSLEVSAATSEDERLVVAWAGSWDGQGGGVFAQRLGGAEPGRLSFGVPRLVVSEGGEPIEIPVYRSEGNVGQVSVDVRAVSGTAHAGQDFMTIAEQTIFDDQVCRPRPVVLELLDDAAPEPVESLALTLADPQGGAALGAISRLEVEVRDDDADPGLVFVGSPIEVDPEREDCPNGEWRHPVVTLAPEGDFLIVWTVCAEVVMARHFEPSGEARGAPVSVGEGFTTGGAALATDSEGNVAVAWQSGTCCCHQHHTVTAFRRYDRSSGEWREPERLFFDPFDCRNDTPGLAFASDGRLVVSVGADAENDLLIASFKADGSLRDVRAGRLNDQRFGGTKLVTLPAGPTLAFWNEPEGSRPGIKSMRVPVAGFSATEPRALPTQTAGDQGDPEVIAPLRGSALAVWGQLDHRHELGHALARWLDGDGAPTGEELVVSTAALDTISGPRIAVGGDRLLVVWDHAPPAGGPTEIRARLFDFAGRPRGRELRFESTSGGAQMLPSVAGNLAGQFVVSWQEKPREGSSKIVAQRFRLDTGCGDGSTLCLHDGRFEARAFWRNPHGEPAFGTGQTRALSSDAGAFWFFEPGNLELAVKVLDGSAENGYTWVFYGALTDVEFSLLVTDTATGETRTYHNPPFVQASRGDIEAFRAAAAFAAVPAPVPAAGEPLLLDRFRVDVEWKDFQDRTGTGQTVALSDETLYAWFFTPGNVELLLKMLDGRTLNGHFWLYYGALSNVEYTITVTDTFSGAVRSYHNPAGRFVSHGDVQAFAG